MKKRLLTNKFGFNSIRSKLMVILSCMSILSIGAVGIANYINSYNMLYEELKITSTQSVEQVDKLVSNYFIGLERQASILTSLPSAREISYKTSSSKIPEVSPEDNLLKTLEQVKEQDSDILAVYYSTPDKRTIIYPAADLTGFDPTTRPWYMAAVDNKEKAVWSEPYIDETSKDMTITVSRAMVENDTIIGVFGIDINLGQFSETLSEFHIGNQGHVFLFHPNGTLISHPDAALIGTDAITKLSIWEDISKKEEGFSDYIDEGARHFGVFQTNKITGWKSIASLPEGELLTDIRNVMYSTLSIGLVIIILTVIISFVISRYISKNVKKLESGFSKASEGDLTANIIIASKDEFGELANNFNLMMKRIRGLMEKVKDSSFIIDETSESIFQMTKETSNALNEIAATVQEVAKGSQEQAADIDSNSQNIGELANLLEAVANSTIEVGNLSNSTKELGNKGLEQVGILVDKTEKTGQSSNKVNEIIFHMKEAAEKINVITDTINQIASQTNLLALNAAIEAARAGEAGRGFSVVADEIRILAEQSSKATQNISNLISNMNHKTNEAVTAMNDTKQVIGEQILSVESTKSIFNEILNSLCDLNDRVQEIEASTMEINHQKDSIVDHTQNISSVSEEISASTEEVSASTEEVTATTTTFVEYSENLKELSQDLIKQINQFKF
ncbi:methyl-accepting chemotaxis protein [Anaerocolumna aminovalerica]|uniref:Methyl-accepting chemotaxis protein n=1 Tax=Anaerocolumna aminovalerica TaxID=1527 RepID=A0A1I5J6V9_9FIRM|nr:methyl-accepting chemotaxis protein [Anaerocolumna aminovalerica]SFO68343.1 methyl-accepting chemotaxis protein [Anaerocolumna aminovalerica]